MCDQDIAKTQIATAKRQLPVSSVNSNVDSARRRPGKRQRTRNKEKKTQIHLKDLAFKMPEVEEERPVPKPRKPQPWRCQDITVSPYYRFSLNSLENIQRVHMNPNISLEWDSIGKVRKIITNDIQCPICLEHSLVAGVINRCGHSFCWPCVIRYIMKYEHFPLVCPVCTERLLMHKLKPVEFIRTEQISEDAELKMVLMTRKKGTVTMQYPGTPVNLCEGLVSDTDCLRIHNRVTLQTEFPRDIQNTIKQLEVFISDDELEKSATLIALEQANEAALMTPPEFVFSLEEFPATSEMHYFLYQSCDGQPFFLDPLNVKMLLTEFAAYEAFPLAISGRVLGVEEVVTTEATRQKMKYCPFRHLNHIGKGTPIYFIELDLSRTVSSATFNSFRQEVTYTQIQKRHWIRRAAKTKEDRTLREIAKRNESEQRARYKYIMQSEPAPPRITRNPIILLEKPAESSEDDAPKSIWSNFEEAMKNPPPPRPRPTPPIESDSDDEEGPRVTLFDLIMKHKRK